MWGEIIQATAAAVNNRRMTNKANRHNIEMRKMAREQFAAQMDESVQRRVKDAQAAGIHPLFALGGSVGASPTVSTGGYAQPPASTGSGIGDALGAIFNLINATTKQRTTESRVDEVDAQLKAAQLARMQEWAASSGRDKIGAPTAPDGTPSTKSPTPGKVETLTSQATSSKPGDPSTEAMVKTPYVEYRRSDGTLGTAFGADVPGAEEINMMWIPLQNWWHTSKKAREDLRDTLGLSSGTMERLQNDPEYTKEFLEKNKHKMLGPKLKRYFRKLGARYSHTQPPRY